MQDSINLIICMYMVMGRKDVIDAILKSSGNMFLDDLMSLLSEESGKLQTRCLVLHNLLQSIWNRCAVTNLDLEGDH